MKEVTFEVAVGRYSGEIEVTVELSDKEYELLKHYCHIRYDYSSDEECEDFSDVEELSELYNRIIEKAYDQLAESQYEDDAYLEELCNGERDWEIVRAAVEEEYDICVDWPELQDDDEDDDEA